MWLWGADAPSAPMLQSQVIRWCPTLPHWVPPSWGAPPQLQVDLWDLNDAQFRQLVEDLWQEAARWEGMVPPMESPFDWCRVLMGGAAAALRPGGCYPQRGRGWGPSEPLQQPTSPPQTEEDVGHLLSTLTAGLRLGTLRINTFSGDATLGQTEVSLEQWYHEVQCVKDHYPESMVKERIIRSLK